MEDRETETKRERKPERQRETECVFVYVCAQACVCERERETDSMSVYRTDFCTCVCDFMCISVSVCCLSRQIHLGKTMVFPPAGKARQPKLVGAAPFCGSQKALGWKLGSS